MSGTIASRFQTRFGYGPGRAVGTYPGATPGELPTVADASPVSFAPPLAQMAQAPSAGGDAPVQAGSIGVDRAEGSNATGNEDMGLGANPGDLGFGGSLSGFGVSNYGTLGGVLGGLAGLATGVPGLGLAGTALGTYEDTRSLNGQLTDMGLTPGIDWGSAFANNATFGLAGRGAGQQWGDIIGFDAFAEAPLSAFQREAPVGSGMALTGDNLPADLDAQQRNEAMDEANFAAGIGLSLENMAPVDPASFGWGGSYGDYSSPDNSFGAGYTDSSASGGFGGENQFMSGGYTGPGHPAEPAGEVHRGEVVIPAAMVARYGLDPLLALVNGEVPPSRLAALVRG